MKTVRTTHDELVAEINYLHSLVRSIQIRLKELYAAVDETKPPVVDSDSPSTQEALDESQQIRSS